MADPQNLPELIEKMRNLVRNGWDCPVVATGYQGRGKSSLMLQVFRRVDPTFWADRVFFSQLDFINACKNLDRYRAVLLDEALVHRRKSMTKESREMVDFYQVNRELRQITGLCFPHIGGLDKELAAKRVMFRFHVQARGYCVVKKPQISTEDAEPGGVYWRPLFAFRFGPCKGRLWDDYVIRKDNAVRAREGGEAKKAAAVEIRHREPDMEAGRRAVQEILQWRPRKGRGPWGARDKEELAWFIEREEFVR